MNPAAHMAGVVAPSIEMGGGEGASEIGSPALRLRLRGLLEACLDYVEGELNKVSFYSKVSHVRQIITDFPLDDLDRSGKICMICMI